MKMWRLLVSFLLLAPAGQGQFVGRKVCAGCHPAQFQTQSKSGHAGALKPAPPGSPGQWAFGAGAKAITYVSQVDEEWYVEHGLSYYPDEKKMAPTPGHDNGLDVRMRTFDPVGSVLRCFRCHSTGPIHLQAGQRVEPSEPGVHCESCHGGGADHVKSKAAAGTILNPKVLNAAALSEFCGTCHRKPPEAGEGSDWRNAWNVRHQPTYLDRAACFRKSNGAMTCLTCHNPHTPLNRATADYDKRCAGCHPSVKHKSQTATQSCVGCHMPQVRASPHLEFTNHWIGVYTKSDPLIPLRR